MNTNISNLSSVRVTFRLSDKAKSIIEKLSDSFQITQKEFFSILADNYSELTVVELKSNLDTEPKKSRTLVLPKYSVMIFEKLAENLQHHRDDILGACINMIYDEIKTKKEKVKTMKPIISSICDKIYDAEKEIIATLGEDHALSHRMGYLSVIALNLYSSLESHIAHNTQISPDDFTDTGEIIESSLTNVENQASNDLNDRVFIKKYMSKVPNVTKSLINPVSIQLLGSKLSKPQLISNIKEYSKLSFWDFGVRATEHLKKGDVVWIATGDSYYKGEIVAMFDDPEGEICDAIGWAKQFKQPWKTPVALKDVEEINNPPGHILRAIHSSHVQGVKNFYKL